MFRNDWMTGGRVIGVCEAVSLDTRTSLWCFLAFLKATEALAWPKPVFSVRVWVRGVFAGYGSSLGSEHWVESKGLWVGVWAPRSGPSVQKDRRRTSQWFSMNHRHSAFDIAETVPWPGLEKVSWCPLVTEAACTPWARDNQRQTEGDLWVD